MIFLSEEMCDQRSKCFYANIGFPASIARSVVEQELTRPISSIFSSFEDQPIAAASIAQVHRGVLLEEGVPVIIKILRPGVAKAFRRDMVLLSNLVKVLSASPSSPP